MSIDKGPQLGDFDTITREEYRRVNGTGPVPSTCAECGDPLSSVQVKRGGRFCSLRCSGAHNARIGNEIPRPPTVSKLPPAPVPAGLHPDEHGLIHIAAALVDVLLAIPGSRSVEMWVGPIGPIEVRR